MSHEHYLPEPSNSSTVPLFIPIDKPYTPSGNGVVSTRTAHHVGFNGYEFRKLNAFPELQNTASELVKRAWPNGLIDPYRNRQGSESEEPVFGTEALKCAPENWIMRRPVSHFGDLRTGWKARYPPRNLLNAKFKKGPREVYRWVPTATYQEPPVPIIEGTTSCGSMKKFALQHSDIRHTLNVLDLLKTTFMGMGNREGIQDRWLQRRVTVPCREVIRKYRDELTTFVERNNGSPLQPLTLKQCLKHDHNNESKVRRIMLERGISSSSRAKTKLFNDLFEEAENTPGALDQFNYMVEKDLKRFSRELEQFKEQQKQFDIERGFTTTRSVCEEFLEQICS